jgi:hypothetical protein
MFRELMERLSKSGEHTRAFLMHEYRVKMARLIGDRPGVLAALKDMREAALASGNPNAILMADSVQNRRTRSRSSPLPPAKGAPAELETASLTASNETVVTTFLRREQGLRKRAEHALHMLGQYAKTRRCETYTGPPANGCEPSRPATAAMVVYFRACRKTATSRPSICSAAGSSTANAC